MNNQVSAFTADVSSATTSALASCPYISIVTRGKCQDGNAETTIKNNKKKVLPFPFVLTGREGELHSRDTYGSTDVIKVLTIPYFIQNKMKGFDWGWSFSPAVQRQ